MQRPRIAVVDGKHRLVTFVDRKPFLCDGKEIDFGGSDTSRDLNWLKRWYLGAYQSYYMHGEPEVWSYYVKQLKQFFTAQGPSFDGWVRRIDEYGKPDDPVVVTSERPKAKKGAAREKS